ncbi:hypothetical protein GF354_03640 [Candidatus Peregrinibacteria bacterium]|nr:hypothetical protein [Candidatus Peregrinibacteria bacterium]
MKSLIKKIILFCLKRMAKRRLKKYRGKIIAVTGSVGKTSTKDAIFTVLNTQFKVHRSKKSMNSEFGLLLTILDIESGFSSARKWMYLLSKAFVNSFRRDLSEVLLLELGVDKPGDMDFLTSVIVPDIAVITNIFPVHMAEGQFNSLKEIFDEKSKLVKVLKEGGTAILNTDDEYIAALARSCPKRKVITFGRGANVSYRIKETESNLDGLHFVLAHKDYRTDVKAEVLGNYNAMVMVPAIICGLEMGMGIEDCVKAVMRYKLPPGRMSIIPAINGATILDSSYNSSPKALREALKILPKIKGAKRKIAVLGSMNELGPKSQQLHEDIGKIAPQYCDVLLTVGADASKIAAVAIEKGMDEKSVHVFKSAKEASAHFFDKVKSGDIILVKGSQNKVRLEIFVKELMEHPEDAKDLLVRQGKNWKNRF